MAKKIHKVVIYFSLRDAEEVILAKCKVHNRGAWRGSRLWKKVNCQNCLAYRQQELLMAKKRGRPNSSNVKAKSAIGRLIRTGRVRNGLGLQDLSKKLGVSLQFVSNIEQGRAPLPLRYATKVAKAIGEPSFKVVQAALSSSKGYQDLVRDLKPLKVEVSLIPLDARTLV